LPLGPGAGAGRHDGSGAILGMRFYVMSRVTRQELLCFSVCSKIIFFRAWRGRCRPLRRRAAIPAPGRRPRPEDRRAAIWSGRRPCTALRGPCRGRALDHRELSWIICSNARNSACRIGCSSGPRAGASWSVMISSIDGRAETIGRTAVRRCPDRHAPRPACAANTGASARR
jgi:hypothetical protein